MVACKLWIATSNEYDQLTPSLPMKRGGLISVISVLPTWVFLYKMLAMCKYYGSSLVQYDIMYTSGLFQSFSVKKGFEGLNNYLQLWQTLGIWTLTWRRGAWYPLHKLCRLFFAHWQLSKLYLLTKLSVPLAKSTSPPVGLTSNPTNPLPVPFSKPTAPSFWRPSSSTKRMYFMSYLH